MEFDDPRDADDACYDLHGVDFMGDRVTVERAKGTPHGRDRERWADRGGDASPPRSRRSRSRSRYRSRSRSPYSRGGGGYRGGDRGGDRGGQRPIWLDKYGPPTRTDYRIIVENLSSSVSWQDLKDFMRTSGPKG